MDDRRNRGPLRRLAAGLLSALDPRAWLHAARIVHYYNYTHVRQVRRLTQGARVRIAPNVSFANAQRITFGDGVQIGARCSLWAGDSTGEISIGEDSTLGPECFVTASDYGSEPGTSMVEQPKRERHVRIGADVWLGARVIVTAGVTIGDGCVVGAGSVVTRDLPEGSIAVGVPARVVRSRDADSGPPSDV